MEHRQYHNDSDIKLMRELISSLPKPPSVTDFEEFIQIQSVQQATCLWFEATSLIAFAYVDDFNNLCFEITPGFSDPILEQEIMDWGKDCIKERIKQTGEIAPLDSSCSALNPERINLLMRMGFTQQEVRSLNYIRSLADPISELPFPPGYLIRCVKGESEVAQLVNLHQAAFGTDNMTVEYRLAMMHAPDYDQSMDWVACSLEGSLAAFCIGSIDEEDPDIGYLDPIGTHPAHRRIGLSTAMIAYGLTSLKSRGVKHVHFGTSSENIPMQQLASRMGFSLQSESVWFSKEVI